LVLLSLYSIIFDSFSYNNLTEREITFYTGWTMQLFLWVLTEASICAKLCAKAMSMQDHLFIFDLKKPFAFTVC
jgi:hypothetical protein